MSIDYYAIIGLEKTVTDAQIKEKYKRFISISPLNPNPGNEETKLFTLAYNILRDPKKRKKYDSLIEEKTIYFTHMDLLKSSSLRLGLYKDFWVNNFLKVYKAALTPGIYISAIPLLPCIAAIKPTKSLNPIQINGLMLASFLLYMIAIPLIAIAFIAGNIIGLLLGIISGTINLISRKLPPKSDYLEGNNLGFVEMESTDIKALTKQLIDKYTGINIDDLTNKERVGLRPLNSHSSTNSRDLLDQLALHYHDKLGDKEIIFSINNYLKRKEYIGKKLHTILIEGLFKQPKILSKSDNLHSPVLADLQT